MLFLYKCNLFKLLVLIIYMYIYYNVFFSIFIKANYNENIFWYFVEILNNNNKSILLFLSILLLSILITFNNNVIYNNIIIIIIMLNLFLLFEYKFNLNMFIKHTLMNYNPNTNLINGVVLIHPILIYVTYTIFLLFIFFYKIDINIFNKILFYIKLYRQKLFLFSFLALFLGGWWAQQELNWGGWWNWDFVEIIALIFNILTIYIIHTNFYKKYNFLFNIIKNIIFYLIFFFLFIRFDVLNSIHAFNSFSILNNFANLVYVIVYFLIISILYSMLYYKNKFNNNQHSSTIVSYFFKITNSIFLMYIFVNLFFILYLNYQFIDITKYIKYILLLLLYTLTLIEFIKSNKTLISSIFVLLFLLNGCYIFHIFDIIIIISFIFLNKNVIKFNNYVVISHYMFIIFILYIKYNNTYIYYYNNGNDQIYLNELFYKNTIIESIKYNNFYNNNNSIYFTNLINYYYCMSYNSYYYNNIIYVNNIICNNNVVCFYNLDKFLNLFFYKLNIIYYMILTITVII